MVKHTLKILQCSHTVAFLKYDHFSKIIHERVKIELFLWNFWFVILRQCNDFTGLDAICFRDY